MDYAINASQILQVPSLCDSNLFNISIQMNFFHAKCWGIQGCPMRLLEMHGNFPQLIDGWFVVGDSMAYSLNWRTSKASSLSFWLAPVESKLSSSLLLRTFLWSLWLGRNGRVFCNLPGERPFLVFTYISLSQWCRFSK